MSGKAHLIGFAALAAYSLRPEAEGLGCSMRIPVTAESEGIEALLGVPKPYTMACYIGIGYPTEETRQLPQEPYTLADKLHMGKW